MEKQTVKKLMSNSAKPPLHSEGRRSKESHELMRLVAGAGTSGLAVMTADDVLCALMAATVKVALRVMKPADLAMWLRQITADIEAEVQSGNGRPS